MMKNYEELAHEAGIVGGCGRSGAAIVECAVVLERLFLALVAVVSVAIAGKF